MTDQFVGRDSFRKIKINIDLFTKNNYNNLYLYNDYIIEELYPLNKESVLFLYSTLLINDSFTLK